MRLGILGQFQSSDLTHRKPADITIMENMVIMVLHSMFSRAHAISPNIEEHFASMPIVNLAMLSIKLLWICFIRAYAFCCSCITSRKDRRDLRGGAAGR